MEAKFQSEVIKWLKMQGVYVIKTRVLPGVPVGCPDIIGLYRNKWLVIECKADEHAKFRPGQQATLQRMRDGGNPFVYVAHPGNWATIKEEIIAVFL